MAEEGDLDLGDLRLLETPILQRSKPWRRLRRVAENENINENTNQNENENENTNENENINENENKNKIEDDEEPVCTICFEKVKPSKKIEARSQNRIQKSPNLSHLKSQNLKENKEK